MRVDGNQRRLDDGQKISAHGRFFFRSNAWVQKFNVCGFSRENIIHSQAIPDSQEVLVQLQKTKAFKALAPWLFSSKQNVHLGKKKKKMLIVSKLKTYKYMIGWSYGSKNRRHHCTDGATMHPPPTEKKNWTKWSKEHISTTCWWISPPPQKKTKTE